MSGGEPYCQDAFKLVFQSWRDEAMVHASWFRGSNQQ